MPVGPPLDETSLVLDTDVLSDWRYEKPHTQRAMVDYVARLSRPPALASITVFEALNGFEKEMLKPGGDNESLRRDRDNLERLIEPCEVLDFTAQAARIAAYVFPRLSKKAQKDHWRDLLIAATALAQGHGVATRNLRDFTLSQPLASAPSPSPGNLEGMNQPRRAPILSRPEMSIAQPTKRTSEGAQAKK